MIHAQNTKLVLLTPPAAKVDNASVTVAELDCRGWDYVTILMIIGDIDIAMSAAKLTDSDSTGASHADIVGTRFGTDDNHVGTTSALPTANDDDSIFAWELDLRKRKRFIDAVLTVGDGAAGAYITVVAILSRGAVSPDTAAEAGAAEILRV